MTAAEYLALFYPWFFQVGGPSFVSEEDRAKYMTAAEAHRPACLPDERQNEAQAHYAAYLMGRTLAWQQAGGAAAAPGTVVRERQGGVEVQYAQGETGGASVATGPATAYASWKALSDLCARGAILAGDAFVGSGGPSP